MQMESLLATLCNLFEVAVQGGKTIAGELAGWLSYCSKKHLAAQLRDETDFG